MDKPPNRVYMGVPILGQTLAVTLGLLRQGRTTEAIAFADSIYRRLYAVEPRRYTLDLPEPDSGLVQGTEEIADLANVQAMMERALDSIALVDCGKYDHKL